MLKAIHTVVNKIISNLTVIKSYGTVMDGVREYHTTVSKDIEINKRKVNSIIQNVLQNTFRKDVQNKGNPYNIVQHDTEKRNLIMHDRIQKFGKELTVVFIRT